MEDYPSRESRKLLCALVFYLIWRAMAWGQIVPPRLDDASPTQDMEALSVAIERANQDVPGSYFYLNEILKAKAVQAIPMLEAKFKRTSDEIGKGEIAAALVKLGDKDKAFWEYLVAHIKAAAESDAPDFARRDAEGIPLPGRAPEFLAWARVHHLDEQSALDQVTKTLPGWMYIAAEAGDPRAAPYLRRALLSPDHLMVITAAEALANFHDRESIPLIVAACRRGPRLYASAIAYESLLYFDDSVAQSEAETYIDPELLKQLGSGGGFAGKYPLDIDPWGRVQSSADLLGAANSATSRVGLRH